jgi:hypothetical protein
MPRERNAPAESSAAGNFSFGPAIFDKRGKPSRREKESKQEWNSSRVEGRLERKKMS